MDRQATAKTRARYDRIAPVYDLLEAAVERLAFHRWRRWLWPQVGGERVLEVGVGTGKNLPYYPEGTRVTAVDLSEKMLERARHRVQDLSAETDLALMDAQHLALADGTFDAAVSTFVFCSVPDPVVGLGELGRVVVPGGPITLLEHVRVNEPLIGMVMDLLDPVVVQLMGPHINRQTVENVRKAGLEVEQVKELTPGGLVKLIVAQPKPE
ncbi:MAG: methyltransferase domain-containing protein [Anaerolineae bacterium]